MPAVRTTKTHTTPGQKGNVKILTPPSSSNNGTSLDSEPTLENGGVQIDLAATDAIFYPLPNTLARASYRNSLGKPLPKHHWEVYDYIRKIPAGRVTTYKAIVDALAHGSPRSVGNALRNNPFAPFIPCHRVIASTKFIGGFSGEWGSSNQHKQGIMVQKKFDMLTQEGVAFDSKGFLLDKGLMWTT